jgi:transposase
LPKNKLQYNNQSKQGKPMGQILHKRATTTHAIRKQIQEHKGDINSIAKKFNIDWTTAKKWQSRNSVEDKPMGNKRANSSLSLDEDWLICEVRRLTWLPLDDLHQILQPMFPKLSRSGLHRCLQYYGISKKPKELQQKPQRSKFKSYEIGYLHIDITDFWLDKKKWSLFVSIDRETKFTYAEIFANKTMENAKLFLQNVYTFYPYKIHTILTDNGLQFSYRALSKELKTNKIHPFDEICTAHNTEHRLTKFAHPWTNGQVEKMNHIIKSATLKLFHYDSIDEYSKHLARFLNYYNFEKKLKSLKFKSPYDKILERYKEKPNLFLGNPYGYCVGLNR